MPVSPDLHHLFHPDHADHYRRAIEDGLDHLTRQLTVVDGPATGAGPEQVAKQVADVDLDRPLGDHLAALDEIGRLWLDDAVWFHEPRYAAHLNCPVVIPALLAELYIAAVNSSLDTFDQSVGGTFIERRLIEWTAGRIGFPGAAADGIFTSGGTQSNLQALAIARLRHPDGTTSRLRILASADGHFSVQKAARLLGLGDAAVIGVRTDADRRMDPAALSRELSAAERDGVPVAVVATAGTTDFGAIDPLPEIAALCRGYGAWLHVDAAYGGGLLVSGRHRDRLAGIEHADSVTVDFHKTFFQPVSSSAVIVRDRSTLDGIRWHADYLNPSDSDNPNQVDKSLQTTRRFDALKLWLTLRVMGPDLIGAYVDTVIELAAEAYAKLILIDDLELAAPPSLSTLVLRHRPAGVNEEHQLRRLNTAIRGALYDSGAAMVAATTVDGRHFLKLTLLNPKATVDDILGIVDQIRATGEQLAAATAGVTR